MERILGLYFGHIHPFMLIVVLIFWSSSTVNVCRCEFFGQVHCFWSYNNSHLSPINYFQSITYLSIIPVSQHQHGQGRDHQPSHPHPLPTATTTTQTVNNQQLQHTKTHLCYKICTQTGSLTQTNHPVNLGRRSG